MRLRTYSIVSSWNALQGTSILIVLAIKSYELLSRPWDFTLLCICIALIVSGFIILQIKSTTTLDSSKKLISIKVYLRKWTISKREISLAKYAWVRARQPHNDIKRITVEVGTRGYETLEILKLPFKAGKGIVEANNICQTISAACALENWAYKEAT